VKEFGKWTPLYNLEKQATRKIQNLSIHQITKRNVDILSKNDMGPSPGKKRYCCIKL